MTERSIILATIVLLSASAHAERPLTDNARGERALTLDNARAERALTLDEALDRARANAHDLRAAHEHLIASASGIEQARAALLPTVGVQGKYTHNYKEVTLDLAAFLPAGAAGVEPIVIQKGEQLDFAANATVPLVVPSAYPGLSAAQKQHKADEATFLGTEANVLFQTGQAFFAAASADEVVSARRHAIEVARLTDANARARLQAGVVNRVEVTRAQLALVRAEQALEEALDLQASAYRSLVTLTQLHEPFRVQAVAVPGPAPEVSPAEAVAQRPEALAAKRSLEAADRQTQSARWRWAPTLSAFGNVRAFNYKGFSGDNYAWAVGAQLDWTLYDGGLRDAQAHQAAAQTREAKERLRALEDNIADDLANARRAVATKRRALGTAERSVQLSKETLDLVRYQHEAGTATQLDLLTAQDNLVTSEVAVAQARFDLALADLSLRKTAGLFPSR